MAGAVICTSEPAFSELQRSFITQPSVVPMESGLRWVHCLKTTTTLKEWDHLRSGHCQRQSTGDSVCGHQPHRLRIPTGFCLKAQGCARRAVVGRRQEERATLGKHQ